MSTDPQPLSSVLQRLFRYLGAPPPDAIGELETVWADVAGPGLAANATAESVQDGILMITCRDGAWASQVRWSERQLIEGLNARSPELNVSAISVSVRPERR